MLLIDLHCTLKHKQSWLRQYRAFFLNRNVNFLLILLFEDPDPFQVFFLIKWQYQQEVDFCITKRKRYWVWCSILSESTLFVFVYVLKEWLWEPFQHHVSQWGAYFELSISNHWSNYVWFLLHLLELHRGKVTTQPKPLPKWSCPFKEKMCS